MRSPANVSSGLGDFAAWIGREEIRHGVAVAGYADALAATLDRDDPPFTDGDPVPPGWHWIFFPEAVRMSEVAPDGHEKPGRFLPVLPLQRRMWAANRMRFLRALRIGERITRRARIAAITPKEGGTGKLIFVTVAFEIAGADGRIATEEEQTYVFRGPADPSAPQPAPRKPPGGAEWRRTVTPDAVLLFRFSALTMNSHRIHYDQPYVTREEGYPGLLVHGPLTQVLLVDLLRRERPDARLDSFAVRAVSPLYSGDRVTFEGVPGADGRSAILWAVGPSGGLAMTAEAAFSR
jgi:3-methylfumaryl-CoA hydratase